MKKQSGFTLIEIVMVLVLLGILTAVAVPKYFDLQKEANEKAAATYAAEYQARLNAHFAKQLMKTPTPKCSVARVEAIKEANKESDLVASETTTGEGASQSTTYGAGVQKLSHESVTKGGAVSITIHLNNQKYDQYKIQMPACSDDPT